MRRGLVRDIKPIKAFASYVVTQEKFVDDNQQGGAYLVPAVTVLAQVTVLPSRKKLRQPPPPEPILLHFQFPCRPESGLCWPDGKQDMQSSPPPPAVHQLPPSRVPGSTHPVKPELPSATAPAPASAPAKATVPEKKTAPAPESKPAPAPAPAPKKTPM